MLQTGPNETLKRPYILTSAMLALHFWENVQSASVRNKHMSGSPRLEGEDNMLLAVFHGPAVPSGPYFSAVLSGWLLLATLPQESA